VGRVAGVIAIRGATAPGAAVRRLERAAAQAAPLQGADLGLAPLTCPRLASLLAAARGDEALAAALDRYAQQVDAGAQQTERAPTAPRRAGAGRGLRPPRPLPAAARVPGTHGRRAPARHVPSPAAAAAPPRGRRATAAAVAPARPVPGRPSPREARGLEWLPVPVSTAAAASSVLDVEAQATPSARPAHEPPRARAPYVPATGVDPRGPIDAPTPLPGDARPAAVTQRPGRAAAAAPAAPPAAAPAERVERHAGAGELAALVRAWEGDLPAEAATTPAASPAAAPGTPGPGPTVPPTAAVTPAAERRGQRQAPTAAAAGDPLAVGDELGRVLVAELRRYGIEVDW
jgi:hypothetical protein